MTISAEQRRRELVAALSAMLQELADDGINDYVVDITHKGFDGLNQTTWDELLRGGLVRSLGHPTLYQLTGSGWLEALRVNGTLDDLRERCVELIKALKQKVQGRNEDGVATVHDFAARGIPAAFVFNAVESGLIGEMFPGRRYDVRWVSGNPWNDGAPLLTIPRDFGLGDLD